jgi:RNA polymerase sigma-70 factor (ECF subfamily)
MIQARTWNEYGRRESSLVLSETPWTIRDRDLANKAGKMDLQAFNDRIFCLCLGYMGNAADARDLTQDTLAKALVHYGQDNPEHVQAWIMAIARNTCLDHLRRRKARGPQQPISEFTAIDWRTSEDNASKDEEIRIVRKAISCLPAPLREVLVLREYGELSYEEISRALDIHIAAVRSRLSRARQAVLRFYLEEQNDRH